METGIKDILIITLLVLIVLFIVFRVDFVRNVIIPANAPITTNTLSANTGLTTGTLGTLLPNMPLSSGGAY